MKRASTKSYETYRNNYFKNLDKYGDMLSPVLDYNEYQAAYNDYYNARLEEGKDTKNINRLIINDQTFEYSITQGRAFKKVLKKLDNNMNLNININGCDFIWIIRYLQQLQLFLLAEWL